MQGFALNASSAVTLGWSLFLLLTLYTVGRLLSYVLVRGNWQPLAAVSFSPQVCEKQSTIGTKHRQNGVTAPQPEPMPSPQAFLLGITVPSHVPVPLIISATGAPGLCGNYLAQGCIRDT